MFFSGLTADGLGLLSHVPPPSQLGIVYPSRFNQYKVREASDVDPTSNGKKVLVKRLKP